MRTHKALLATAFVLSAFAPSLASAGNTPSISALPEVQLPDMLHPKDSPDSLAASDTIEGLRITPGHRREFGNVEALDGRCVTLGSMAPGAVPSGNANVMIRASSSALPLRTEKFVGVDAGKPELEIVDGWIDLKSSGIKEVRTTRVKLARLGSGPSGYVIYGFRSEGQVHVVFPTPTRFVYVDSLGRLGFVGCQHARLVLDPAASSGSLVRVSGSLESRPAKKAPDQKPGAFVPPPILRGMEATVSVSKLKRDREALLSVTATWSEDEPPMPVIGAAQAVPEPMPVEDDLGGMGDRE